MLVHFLIPIADGEYGIGWHLKGQQSGRELRLQAGESVEGGTPAWVVNYTQNPVFTLEVRARLLTCFFMLLTLLLMDCWEFVFKFNY